MGDENIHPSPPSTPPDEGSEPPRTATAAPGNAAHPVASIHHAGGTPPDATGVRPLAALMRSFGYAFAGLGHAIRTQQNVRIQLGLGAAVVAAGLWLDLPSGDWVLLLLTIALVIAAEIANTALETVVNLVSPGYHPLAKVAKDAAAAAVLVLALAAIVIGLLILGPPLLARWRG